MVAEKLGKIKKNTSNEKKSEKKRRRKRRIQAHMAEWKKMSVD